MEQSGKPGLVGRKLAHYEIRSAIGAGGMGEVFRARDTRLERDIALKVLPANMAADPERFARFQREARAVAALNHPNVVTVFSVENTDDVHFITMELIEGHTLDRLIPSDGLEAHRIVEIGGEIAEALAAAHDKGIVHRDLKPANVMVTNEGRVKVLDFGLAKDVESSVESEATRTSPGLTQAGVVMGTPSYMSPEQVSGRPLDHRSDLYSLGVVMFEMATGHRPFDARSSAELISSILRDTPPPVTEMRPDLPSDLARVIRRCLEKDPRHRMQSARDISNEFRDLARATMTRGTPLPAATTQTPASTPAITPSGGSSRLPAVTGSGAARAEEGFWVAVLPFKTSGGSADLKVLAEGLTEEIVTGLSRFSSLRVIARGSTAKYSNESGDVRDIGKSLGARYVIEGSLRQAGAKLRVAVQVADTLSGTQLWAETYERPFSPETLFDIQDDLVPRIVATVADQNGVLTRSMGEIVRNKDPETLTPHEAVMRAFSFFTRISQREHAEIRDILERIVREYPNHSDSWAVLALIYRAEYAQGYNTRPDPLARGLAAARRAVNLAPAQAMGHYALASIQYFDKDKVGFRVEAEKALALNPMDASAKALLGMLYGASGDWERGVKMVKSAIQMNPNCPGYFYIAGCCDAYRRGAYQEAIEDAIRMNMPDYFHVPAMLAACFGQLGRIDEAKKSLNDLLAIRPDFASAARSEYLKWYGPELAEHVLDGLRKAGLDIPDAPGAAPAAQGHS